MKITIFLPLIAYILIVAGSCRTDCYPNTEHYFVTRFMKNGKTTDPGYTNVYSPGGKGNIPFQETRYGERFYCLPIPLGKDQVTYYFEKPGIKDSIAVYYIRTETYQSEKCGMIIRYSNATLKSSSFTNVIPNIVNTDIADNDTYEITITL